MRTAPLVVLSCLTCLGCAGGADRGPAAATTAVHWPFDDAAPGQPPAGWTTAYTGASGDAAWAIAADATANSPPQALRLLHAASPSKTYNLAWLAETTFLDVRVAVHLRADGGEEDQGGGVVWRLTDADNYYVCRLNPLEGNFRVYKVVAGARTQLGSADLEADAGRWYEITAEMRGDRIRCLVDGRQLLAVEDPTLGGPGHVGVWTKADAASTFDDFRAAMLVR